MNEFEGKFELFYQYSKSSPRIVMTLHPDATLEEAIGAFETFLKSVGYVFEGQLEINGNVYPPAEEN